jgi:hypothetical protein
MSAEQFKANAENPQTEGPARPKRGNGAAHDDAGRFPVDAGPLDGPENAEGGDPSSEELDAEEREYQRLTRALPSVAGAAAAGIVVVGVGKTPDKNEFFRTRKGFCPIADIVNVTAGMEQKFFVVDASMLAPLEAIGIRTAPHVLYLTITTHGVLKVVPVRCADEGGDRNDYAATKETALLEGIAGWVRMYTDTKAGNYRIFPAPPGRFPEPVWPELTAAKVFSLAFRARGCLIDSVEHPRFAAWAASYVTEKTEQAAAAAIYIQTQKQ